MPRKKITKPSNVAGGGVPSLYIAKTTKDRERKRIQLVVDIDRAITTKDYTALVKLELECEGLPLLKKIKEALNG